MLSDETVAVIGAGNIGRAVIGGMIRSQRIESDQVIATRRTQAALDAMADEFPGLLTTTNNVDAVRNASIILLTIKPQSRSEVITEIREHVSRSALVVSVLAGVTTERLQMAFGSEQPVVRVMPNTPALVDEGATAITGGAFTTDEHVDTVRHMFEAVGQVVETRESLLDAVTGLSGSGPAYVYMFIEALTDAGVQQGLSRDIAARLAAQTVYGAAKLVLETGKHPAILRDEVTTPGGTAIAAVSELESRGLRTTIINAVNTATERSKALNEE
ncbi:pyrroline-5-carboxylate reductase [Longibacter salinarum]|uniref:Pyrroline-5-carboxylate reductase n=1 Tax=Longibacter salinarum TaxID=1850348 RepID=A0A2A8D351_9BACT|nr:pyrroline-5-carboxylate reductase [Longibacter salinarum]PEN15223.1 pyrroline-5-carboxylate reductase [Longibacter salinarum]